MSNAPSALLLAHSSWIKKLIPRQPTYQFNSKGRSFDAKPGKIKIYLIQRLPFSDNWQAFLLQMFKNFSQIERHLIKVIVF